MYRNYLTLTLLTVALLYGAGVLPDGLFLIKWLMIIGGGIGVIKSFQQPVRVLDRIRSRNE